MYPTQLAAERMAGAIGKRWEGLLPESKQTLLDLADAACKGIVEGGDGWRIVRTGEDGIRHGSKPHVAIFEEWTP